jgi:hypothetical protein
MQRPFFHFYAVGYRRNPFGALTDEEWAAIALLPAAAAQALAAGFAHLQLLGPMGTGKSTTLLALQARFQQLGRREAYEYLPEGTRRFETETAVLDTFLLDEAQRLSWRQRRRLVGAGKRGVQLVVSSHEDLTPLFARSGLALTSVSLDEEVTVEWVTAVIQQRLAYFALPDRPRAALTPDAFVWLHRRYGRNLRRMEYFLYDVWQTLETPEPVSADTLAAIH